MKHQKKFIKWNFQPIPIAFLHFHQIQTGVFELVFISFHIISSLQKQTFLIQVLLKKVMLMTVYIILESIREINFLVMNCSKSVGFYWILYHEFFTYLWNIISDRVLFIDSLRQTKKSKLTYKFNGFFAQQCQFSWNFVVHTACCAP